MTTYQIKDWNRLFENNRSRQIDKCGYVFMPNKQGGMGFTHIMAEPDGAAIFGIFCLLAEACSHQRLPRHGWLTDDGKADGKPWTAEALALRWRREPAEVSRALQVLANQGVGWLLIAERHPGVTPASPSDAKVLLIERKKERKTDRQTGGRANAPEPQKQKRMTWKEAGEAIQKEDAAQALGMEGKR